MSSRLPSIQSVAPPARREETLLVAVLLAFAGGYLDTYTWITHGVLANAETTLTLSVPVFVLLLVLLVCSLARPIEASEQF